MVLENKLMLWIEFAPLINRHISSHFCIVQYACMVERGSTSWRGICATAINKFLCSMRAILNISFIWKLAVAKRSFYCNLNGFAFCFEPASEMLLVSEWQFALDKAQHVNGCRSVQCNLAMSFGQRHLRFHLPGYTTLYLISNPHEACGFRIISSFPMRFVEIPRQL